MRGIRRAILLVILGILSGNARAWVLKSGIWPDGSVPVVLQFGDEPVSLLDGSSTWNQPAEEAAAEWNPYIRDVKFETTSGPQSAGGSENRINEAFFSPTVYGKSFGAALAITRTWYSGDTVLESDVVVNSAVRWNSYHGSMRQTSAGQTIYDIRRALAHEFGHVLRLDHPDDHGQDVYALMNSQTGSLESLTSDDVSGARVLYKATDTPLPTTSGRRAATGKRRLACERVPAEIPDRGTVKSTIRDGDGGQVRGTVFVRIDIRHFSRGSLLVRLGAPSGRTVTLFRGRSSDRHRTLRRTFRVRREFDGLESNGRWTLSVTDRVKGGTGVIADWSLEYSAK